MNKRLILTVECANEFASGLPSAFTIDLCDQEIERIRTLARAVVDLQAQAIHDEVWTGVWGEDPGEEGDYDPEAEQPQDYDAMAERIIATQAKVDLPRLVVMRDSFFFESVPHDCNEDMKLYTGWVMLSVLDEPNRFYAPGADA